MENSKARVLAEEIIDKLRPHCERIQIAGSVRRGKVDVHDVEIVAAPLLYHEPNLLGEQVAYNPLETYPWSSIGSVLKGGPKYKQIKLDAGVNLDLFIVLPPAQWGVILTIRTGPAEFSQWCVTQRKKRGGLPSDCSVQGGGVYRNGSLSPLPMSEEIDFLTFLGLGWIEPKDRAPKW